MLELVQLFAVSQPRSLCQTCTLCFTFDAALTFSKFTQDVDPEDIALSCAALEEMRIWEAGEGLCLCGVILTSTRSPGAPGVW